MLRVVDRCWRRSRVRTASSYVRPAYMSDSKVGPIRLGVGLGGGVGTVGWRVVGLDEPPKENGGAIAGKEGVFKAC